MLRGQVFAGIAIALAVCALASAAPFTPQPFTQRGTVTAVVDPVTLDVRLTDGASERVELVGLQPPAAGSCALPQAIADLGALVSGKSLWLVVVPPKGKAKHVVRAYAILPGGADVGLELVRRGDATVGHGQGPFKKLAAYTRAQKTAQVGKLGIWGCTSATPSPASPPAPQGQAHGHDQSQPGKGSNKSEKNGDG